MSDIEEEPDWKNTPFATKAQLEFEDKGKKRRGHPIRLMLGVDFDENGNDIPQNTVLSEGIPKVNKRPVYTTTMSGLPYEMLEPMKKRWLLDPEIVKLNKYFEEFKLSEQQKKEEVLFLLKYGHFKRDQQKQFHEMLRKAYPNITDEMIGFWDQLSLHETREKR